VNASLLKQIALMYGGVGQSALVVTGIVFTGKPSGKTLHGHIGCHGGHCHFLRTFNGIILAIIPIGEPWYEGG
jgi:hypothetical protein